MIAVKSNYYSPESEALIELSNGEEFIVQLSGGNYLHQIGCWISGPDQDFDFDDIEYAHLEDDIVQAAENAYLDWVTDKNNEELKPREQFKLYKIHQNWSISATATAYLNIEKSNLGRYRIIQNQNGYISPNDYSAFPEYVQPVYFDDLDDCLNFLKDDKKMYEAGFISQEEYYTEL